MTNRIYIKPAKAGDKVYDPSTFKPIPDAGKSVPAVSYWLRRLRDGSVIEVEPGAEIVEDEKPKAAKVPRRTYKKKGEES